MALTINSKKDARKMSGWLCCWRGRKATAKEELELEALRVWWMLLWLQGRLKFFWKVMWGEVLVIEQPELDIRRVFFPSMGDRDRSTGKCLYVNFGSLKSSLTSSSMQSNALSTSASSSESPVRSITGWPPGSGPVGAEGACVEEAPWYST